MSKVKELIGMLEADGYETVAEAEVEATKKRLEAAGFLVIGVRPEKDGRFTIQYKMR